MEAAKPIFIPTPFPKNDEFSDEIYDEKDKTMTEIKSFEINLTNGKYTLELAKSESNKYIIMKSYNDKQKKLKYFISYCNLDSFYTLNDFFKFYKTIDELYKLLSDSINKNKFSITIKEKNVSLALEFIMPGDKIIDISFELKEKKVKNEELIEQLYEIVNHISEENEMIKGEINNLKNENNSLREEVKNKNEESIILKNHFKNIYEEIKLLKGENEELKEKLKSIEDNLNKKKVKKRIEDKEENYEKKEEVKEIEKQQQKEEQKSKIESKEKPSSHNISTSCPSNQSSKKEKEEKSEEIKKNEDKEENKIKEGNKSNIKKVINIDNFFKDSKLVSKDEDKKNLLNWLSSKGNISEIKLIYRATENGDDSESFFNKCRNMGPTISLIKTRNNRIFGGFTKAEWTDKKGKIKLKDENAFLFSLDNKEKYNILKSDIAISCYPDNFTLVYGNKDDRYGIRLFSGFLQKTCYENLSNKVYNATSDYCLTGYNKFNVQEAEVFQVIFE